MTRENKVALVIGFGLILNLVFLVRLEGKRLRYLDIPPPPSLDMPHAH